VCKTGVLLKRETVEHLWPHDKAEGGKSMNQVSGAFSCGRFVHHHY
jgi:hypothetical protein